MSRHIPSLLPQVSFSILLALSLRPRHGYELMQQVEHDSQGKIKLGPGALYGAIKQLIEAGFIEEAEDIDTTHSRRRYYQLTKAGRKRLHAEVQYFENAVSIAKERRALGNAFGGLI